MLPAEPLSAPGTEADTLQRLYCQEIERVLTEIDSLLGKLYERLDATMTQARDTLRVLKSCYRENTLSVPALDVLLQHLLALVGMFKHKLKLN